MAEMPVAVRTAHFGADHAVAGVADFVDRIDVDRRGEAGPARSAVIFFLGIEQFRAAARDRKSTSELQSLMRISYAVFCLKKKRHTTTTKDQCTCALLIT